MLDWENVVEGPGWLIDVTENPAGEGKRRWFLNDFQYRCSAEGGDGPAGALTGFSGTIEVAMVMLHGIGLNSSISTIKFSLMPVIKKKSGSGKRSAGSFISSIHEHM